MRRRVTSRQRQTTIGVSGTNAAVGYYNGVNTFFLWILIILHVTVAAAVPSPFVLWTTLLVDGGGVPEAGTATTASFVFRTGNDHHNKHTHTAVVVCQAHFGKACRSNTAIVPPCYYYDDPHGRRREERRRSVVLQGNHNDAVENGNGENDEIEIMPQQPPYYYLSVAATHLKEASMALLLLDDDNDNDDGNDLLDASNDLERASMAWQDEEEGGWEEVAMELGSCSTSLVRRSNPNNSPNDTNQKYARASEALWEASQIGGCLSVGPMASASFMEDFAAELETISTTAANEKNCPSAKHLQAAASAIQSYVHSCIG
eukprot:scaffold70552_cov47-Attheya_sp.AAC.2